MKVRWWGARRVRRGRTTIASSLTAPTAPPEQLGPPGWYRDPAGSRRLRWFDGRYWSDRYRDGSPPAVRA